MTTESRAWTHGPWTTPAQYGGGGTFWGWHLAGPDRRERDFGCVYGGNDHPRGRSDVEMIALAPELAEAVIEAAEEAMLVPMVKRCYSENLCIQLADRLFEIDRRGRP